MQTADPCPACGLPAIRPDVVWFGERPYQLERIHAAVAACGLFVSVGTSGTVQPAAGLVRRAKQAGARTVELNLEPSARAQLFDEARHGPASEVVPEWVGRMLGGAIRPA
jgi:NAD-dependent deacetylase